MLTKESRIQDVYKRRRSEKTGRYSLFNEGQMFLIQEAERALLALLIKNGVDSLASKTILDIGCGSGYLIRQFVKLGATPTGESGRYRSP